MAQADRSFVRLWLEKDLDADLKFTPACFCDCVGRFVDRPIRIGVCVVQFEGYSLDEPRQIVCSAGDEVWVLIMKLRCIWRTFCGSIWRVRL